MAVAAAASCTQSHATNAGVETERSDLALLLADEKLPSEMLPVTPPPPTLPPRFCSVPTFPGGPVPAPPPGLAESPVIGAAGAVAIAAAGTGVAGSAGSTTPPNGPDPLCATVPIGQWTFDDCNSFQTELFDSAQNHAAFRTVDLACGAGQQGMAVSFSKQDDLVYVPDQPAYALDFGVTIAAWVRPDSVTGTQTLFRKRDDGDSAFALVLTDCKYEFVLRLTSGRLVHVSAPAKANTWQHVAATYDGLVAKLYLDGQEVGSAEAPGVLVRGIGPLLMGNDGSGRRFHGRLDNVWFNTQAAPASTIDSLLCLRSDPVLRISPEIGPTVAAGTPVTYSLFIEDVEDARCGPISLQVNGSSQTLDITVEPSFAEVSLSPGTTQELAFTVKSGADIEAGSYPLDFSVFNSSGFGFGGPVVGPAPVFSAAASGSVADPAGSPAGDEATQPDDPIRPPPTGFGTVQAQYVVAEPEGCHVSSQRELMIRDVSVVEDPVRTVLNGTAGDPSDGVWSFGGLMQRLSPAAADAADNAERMFRSFLTPQTLNTFAIPERTPMEALVLSSWPRTPDGKLDLARAPMRLLAITHRLDLTDLKNGKAGEGRFTFGVLDPMGFPMQFTIIFEYMLQARDEEESRAWIDAVHALQDLPFPSAEYNRALQALTDRYSGRGVREGAPNASALIDIRTNELALSLDGRWQLREFRIDPESGSLAPHTLFQTPDRSFNGTEALARWVNANEAAVLAETHETPAVFEGAPFAGAAVFNDIDFWDAPGIANPDARHKFSLNTCNGCHGQETQTFFLHINPRLAGEASTLSGFLTGINVADPITGAPRRLNELARRRGLLEALICK